MTVKKKKKKEKKRKVARDVNLFLEIPIVEVLKERKGKRVVLVQFTEECKFRASTSTREGRENSFLNLPQLGSHLRERRYITQFKDAETISYGLNAHPAMSRNDNLLIPTNI